VRCRCQCGWGGEEVAACPKCQRRLIV
jgi:hypothetical protein